MYATHRPASKKPISLWLHHPITVTDMLILAGVMWLLQTWQPLFALLLNDNVSYRWLTAHFVHVNWQHWLLNAAVLLLLPMLLPMFSRKVFGLLLVWLSVGISLFLLFFAQLAAYHVTAYVGLSGVLHGLYFYAALNVLVQTLKQHVFSVIPQQNNLVIQSWDVIQSLGLVVAMLIKLVAEQQQIHSVTQAWLNAPVVYAAHADGVILAALFATGQLVRYSICFYSLNHNSTK